MKIERGWLLDENVWLEGWIVKTIFKKVFLPFNLECGFHYQWLCNKDKNKLWKY